MLANVVGVRGEYIVVVAVLESIKFMVEQSASQLAHVSEFQPPPVASPAGGCDTRDLYPDLTLSNRKTIIG